MNYDSRNFGAVALAVALLVNSPVAAAPARFWLSSSATNPAAAVAPQLGVQGHEYALHIWGQPATLDADDPWNASTNQFKTLHNISLNVITDQPVVDFLNTGIQVLNPILPVSSKRYQFVHDASVGLTSTRTATQVEAGMPDEIKGLQGFSIEEFGTTYTGIGPSCNLGIDNCATTAAGSPAWLIASVRYVPIVDEGTVNFYLQIGNNGMNHAGEDSAATLVAFGTNATTYNASTQRQADRSGDLPDFVIEAVASTPGDYNVDGFVNAADFTLWRDTLGSTTNPAADGNGNSSIDPGDYGVWKSNFGIALGSGSASNSTEIAEPATFLLAWAALCLTILFCSPRRAIRYATSMVVGLVRT